jgi:hypothetical protein
VALRKLRRQPARFDSLDLFRQLDTPSGGAISDPARIEAVFAQICGPLSQALSTESTVQGWRTQALFGSLVVALDGCELLLSVDSGEMFTEGEEIKPPDFLLVLRDGRRLLVEVKGVPPSKPTGSLRLPAKEMRGLQRFSDLMGIDLFVAGFLAAFREWVLVPSSAFEVDPSGRYVVDVRRAFQTNEMAALGDVMLGVVPPIRLDLLPNESVAHDVAPDGTARFTIEKAELRIGGQLMVEKAERRLAMFLLRFNQWAGREEQEIDGSTIRRLSFVCEPEQRASGHEFEIVGKLSSMYTRWFDEATCNDKGEILALQTSVEPGVLPALLPVDFTSANLPLWRFTLLAQPLK